MIKKFTIVIISRLKYISQLKYLKSKDHEVCNPITKQDNLVSILKCI